MKRFVAVVLALASTSLVASPQAKEVQKRATDKEKDWAFDPVDGAGPLKQPLEYLNVG